MNWKTWAPIAVAVLLGLFAAKIGRNVIAARAHTAPPTTVKVVRVVQAAGNVNAGSALSDADLVVVQLPESAAPEFTFGNVSDLVDRVAVVPLVKGQPILEPMLAPKGTPNGLTAVVPDGMRAITIEINEVSGVGGMLMPGCHVDLVMTLMADASGPTEARTVADNVKILAVGRKFGPQPTQPSQPGGPAEPPDNSAARTVTLVVTPAQAHIVELATRSGTPRFILRGARDNAPTQSISATLAELRGNGKTQGKWEKMLTALLSPATQPAAVETASATGAKPTTAPAPQDVWTVQVIRNTVESTVSMPVKPGELKGSKGAKPAATPAPDIAGTDASSAVKQ